MEWLVVMNAWEPPEDSPLCWPSETVTALAALGHSVEVLAGLVPHQARVPAGVQVRAWQQRHHQGDLTWDAFYHHAAERLRQEKSRRTISFINHIPAAVMHPWMRVGEAHHPQGIHDHWPWPFNWWVGLRQKLRDRGEPLHLQETRAFTQAQVQKVISISPAMTRSLRESGLSDLHIAEVRPGIRLPAPSVGSPTEQRMPWLQKLGLGNPATVMLWPTPGMPRDWFDSALTALRELLPRVPTLTVLLAGDMAYHHHAQAVDFGLRERFRLLPTAGNMASLLPVADFTLNLTPAAQSGSRHTLMSLAGGVPVITPAQDGASAWLAENPDTPAGLILDEPDNPGAIRQVLEDMLSHPRAQAMRQAAQQLAPSLTIQRHVEALLQAVG